MHPGCKKWGHSTALSDNSEGLGHVVCELLVVSLHLKGLVRTWCGDFCTQGTKPLNTALCWPFRPVFHGQLCRWRNELFGVFLVVISYRKFIVWVFLSLADRPRIFKSLDFVHPVKTV